MQAAAYGLQELADGSLDATAAAAGAQVSEPMSKPAGTCIPQPKAPRRVGSEAAGARSLMHFQGSGHNNNNANLMAGSKARPNRSEAQQGSARRSSGRMVRSQGAKTERPMESGAVPSSGGVHELHTVHQAAGAESAIQQQVQPAAALAQRLSQLQLAR